MKRNATLEAIMLPEDGGFSSFTIPDLTRRDGKGQMGFNLFGYADFKVKDHFFVTTGLGISYKRFGIETVLDTENLLLFASLLENNSVGAAFVQSLIRGLGLKRSDLDPEMEEIPILAQSPDSRALYLGIPLYFNYAFAKDRLRLNTGFELLLLTYSKVSSHVFSRRANTVIEVADTSSDGLNNLLFNVGAGISYKVHTRASVSFQYQRTVSDFYEIDRSEENAANYDSWSTKLNNFSFGIAYHFINKTKE